jgi:hypothetical protein
MSLINRSVVIVYAKQPFVEWLNRTLADNVAIEEVNEGCPAFLIEDFEYEDDAAEAVYEEWEVYFETWLESWIEDEALWPKERTEERFREWFEVRLHPMVFDRLDESIVHEDEFESRKGGGRALH